MNKSDSQFSNKLIFKALSLFGGVQFIRVIAGVIQTKVVAVFIGVEGVGIISILRTILALIESISSLGLNMTATREFSLVAATEDVSRYSSTYRVLFVWSLASGALGTLITVLLSPILSLWSFGSSDYIVVLAFASVAVIFNSQTTFYNSNLQGLRSLKRLAYSAVCATLSSVFLSIIVLFFLRRDGIALSIFLSSLVTFLFSWYFSSKHQFVKTQISLAIIWIRGTEMIKYGALIALSGLITTLFLYLLKVYLVHVGGLTLSGLYQAASNIFEGYLALIFVALSTDYFPRLSQNSNDDVVLSKLANQQALMNLLLMLPIILVFIPFVPLLIEVLYSPDFLGIVTFVYWATFGLILKSASWSIGYILFAKGNSKQIILNSVFFNLIFFLIHAILFHYYGLVGLGIAYLLYYFIHLIGVYFIVNKFYLFTLSKEFYKYLLITIVFLIVDLLVTLYVPSFLGYFVIFLLFIISLLFLLDNIGVKYFREHFRWKIN